MALLFGLSLGDFMSTTSVFNSSQGILGEINDEVDFREFEEEVREIEGIFKGNKDRIDYATTCGLIR